MEVIVLMRKTFNRNTVIALALLYIFSLVVIPVAPADAVGSITLTIDKVSIPAVETVVNIPVMADDVSNIQAFGIKFEYDRSKLEFAGWSGTNSVFGSSFNAHCGAKTSVTDVNVDGLKPTIAYNNMAAVGMSASEDDGGLGVSGPGILFSIKFKVLVAEATAVAFSTVGGEVCVTNSTDNASFTTINKVDGGLIAAPVPVTGVTLDQGTLTLTAGGASGTLTATVAPANADNKNVTWESSNTAVATVADGVVTPVAAGTATITVRTVDGGHTATCTVTVNAAPAPALAGVSFADAPGFMNNGKTVITLPAASSAGNTFKYKISTTGSAIDRPNAGEPSTGWTPVANGDMIAVPNGTHIGVVEVNANGLIVAFVDAIAVVGADEEAPFTISLSPKTTDPFLKVTANVKWNSGSHHAVVVFQLMNGNTPVSIVALEKDITGTEEVSALFPGYKSGTVTVMVLDTLTVSTTQTGTILAETKSL